MIHPVPPYHRNPSDISGPLYHGSRANLEEAIGGARDIAEDGVRALLLMLGEDPDRGALRDVPRRTVDAVLRQPDTFLAWVRTVTHEVPPT